MKTSFLMYLKYFVSIFTNIKMNVAILKIAAPLGIGIYYIQKYLFDQWEFLGFLIVLMTADTMAGFILAWKKKKICSEEFSKVFIKGFAYAVFMVVVHVITHVKITGKPIPFLDLLDYLALSSLMIREALSIFDKLSKLVPGLVPKWLKTRLKGFDNLSGELLSKKKTNES